MKIAVLGYCGAGKSTLARELGQRYRCEVLHLDAVQYMAGWKERDRAESIERVKTFMERDDWVIDGNYTRFLQPQRLEEADRIIFLNFDRVSCLFRVLKRGWRFRGRTRPDMAEGCTEKTDWDFIRWTLWDGRTPERRAHYRQICTQYAEKIVILKNQRQINRYLEELSC